MSTADPFSYPFAPALAPLADLLRDMRNQVKYLTERVSVLESRPMPSQLHLPLQLQPFQPAPPPWHAAPMFPPIQWPEPVLTCATPNT